VANHGIVDQDVDAAASLDQRGHHCLDGGTLSEVGGHGEGLHCVARLDTITRLRLCIKVMQHDIGAGLGETVRHRKAKPVAGSGHERPLSPQEGCVDHFDE
jgi:hypothetical protein